MYKMMRMVPDIQQALHKCSHTTIVKLGWKGNREPSATIITEAKVIHPGYNFRNAAGCRTVWFP